MTESSPKAEKDSPAHSHPEAGWACRQLFNVATPPIFGAPQTFGEYTNTYLQGAHTYSGCVTSVA